MPSSAGYASAEAYPYAVEGGRSSVVQVANDKSFEAEKPDEEVPLKSNEDKE